MKIIKITHSICGLHFYNVILSPVEENFNIILHQTLVNYLGILKTV